MTTPDKIMLGLSCHSRSKCSECPYEDMPECSSKLAADAAVMYKQLEAAQPKWISVEERLPEFERRALVVNGHGRVFILAFWRKTENKWSWIDESSHFKHYNDITHWMPLPEPPKEDA